MSDIKIEGYEGTTTDKPGYYIKDGEEKKCTCYSGYRYIKGVLSICPVCKTGTDSGLKSKLNALTTGKPESETVTQDKIVDVNSMLKIPEIVKDKEYSRANINKLTGFESNIELFDYLDYLLVELQAKRLVNKNIFFSAPQDYSLDLWAYTFIKTAYNNYFSVVPYFTVEQVRLIQKMNDIQTDRSVEFLDINNVDWMDFMVSDVVICELQPNFNNYDLITMMNLAKTRIKYNKLTYIISYWASNVIKKSYGGDFVFNNVRGEVFSKYDVYEYFKYNERPKQDDTKYRKQNVSQHSGNSNMVWSK